MRRVAQDESAEVEQPNRARNRDRTDDLILTKDVLYRLSYASNTACGTRTGHGQELCRVHNSLESYVNQLRQSSR